VNASRNHLSINQTSNKSKFYKDTTSNKSKINHVNNKN